MKFDLLKNAVSTYETVSDTPVSNAVRKIISDNTIEIFKDRDALVEAVMNTGLSETEKAQLALVFRCSALPDYILNTSADLNMVDMNNLIHNIRDNTDLTYKRTVELVSDVMYGCGLRFSIEYGPQMTDDTIEYNLHAVMPEDMAEEKVRSVTERFNSFNSKYAFSDAASLSEEGREEAGLIIRDIKSLCNAGVSEGFYLLGRCYLEGRCGTDRDPAKAEQLMRAASEQGNIKANAALGDIYFGTENYGIRDYTLAHHFYTKPGTLAAGEEQQQALAEIYRQGDANRTSLIFSVIAVILTAVFVGIFHKGIFSEKSTLIWGIILTVLSAAASAFVFIYHKNRKYNGIRWITALQYLLWLIYALILVLV